MKLSYKKLWQILIDTEMNKKKLAIQAGISQYTINKLNRGETVTTETLVKICEALSCNIGDICDISDESNSNEKKSVEVEDEVKDN